MALFSIFAIYFIIWWLTLFLVLPLGLRTQAEADEVVPGTVESAPARFRPLLVFGLTSVLAAIIHLGWYLLSVKLGIGLDTFPDIAPKFY